MSILSRVAALLLAGGACAGSAPHVPESVRAMLGAMPPSAYAGIVVPAPARTERAALRFLELLSRDVSTLQAAHEQFVVDQARALGVEARPSKVAGLLRSLSIEPDEPMAVFLDLGPMHTRAVQAGQWLAEGDSWRATDPSESTAPLGFHDLIHVVVGVAVRDPGPAQAAFAHLGLTESNLEDGVLWLSNSAELLREVTTAEPLAHAYATEACPALHADEIVMLSRMDLFWRLGAEELSLDAIANPVLQDVERQRYAPADRFTSGDPAVTTLKINEDGLRLSSRLDLSRHTHLVRDQGTPVQSTINAGALPDQHVLIEFALPPEMRRSVDRHVLSPWRTFQQMPGAGEAVRALQAGVIGMRLDNPVEPRIQALFDVEETSALLDAVTELPGFHIQSEGTDAVLSLGPLPPLTVAAGDGRMAAAPTGAEAQTLLEAPARSDADDERFFSRIRLSREGLPVVTRLLGALGGPWEQAGRIIASARFDHFEDLRAGKRVEGDWQETYLTLHLAADESR